MSKEIKMGQYFKYYIARYEKYTKKKWKQSDIFFFRIVFLLHGRVVSL
jgi:hypothetical protein